MTSDKGNGAGPADIWGRAFQAEGTVCANALGQGGAYAAAAEGGRETGARGPERGLKSGLYSEGGGEPQEASEQGRDGIWLVF